MAGQERRLAGLASPLALEELVPGDGPWELELGFGKGKYLLRRALEEPGRRFAGIEIANEYYKLLTGRAARRGATNLLAFRGEALYLLSSLLPRGFAEVVHVYFPDPWPKTRHQKRRLFDPETVDLVLGALVPGGRLFFATDFLAYGELVAELLAGHPQLEVERLDGGWPEGPRTHFEAKYITEGRSFVRLVATLVGPPEVHPAGRLGLLSGMADELSSPHEEEAR